jgi:hypothetical protein
MRACLCLTAYVGLRRREIHGLRAIDVQVGPPLALHLRNTKGSRDRVIPVGQETLRRRRLYGPRLTDGCSPPSPRKGSDPNSPSPDLCRTDGDDLVVAAAECTPAPIAMHGPNVEQPAGITPPAHTTRPILESRSVVGTAVRRFMIGRHGFGPYRPAVVVPVVSAAHMPSDPAP